MSLTSYMVKVLQTNAIIFTKCADLQIKNRINYILIITFSDSVCRLEATNTGFCWLLTSVTCHVSHVTQTVIGPMQASTVGGVSLRLRWNNRLKFVPINV